MRNKTIPWFDPALLVWGLIDSAMPVTKSRNNRLNQTFEMDHSVCVQMAELIPWMFWFRDFESWADYYSMRLDTMATDPCLVVCCKNNYTNIVYKGSLSRCSSPFSRHRFADAWGSGFGYSGWQRLQDILICLRFICTWFPNHSREHTVFVSVSVNWENHIGLIGYMLWLVMGRYSLAIKWCREHYILIFDNIHRWMNIHGNYTCFITLLWRNFVNILFTFIWHWCCYLSPLTGACITTKPMQSCCFPTLGNIMRKLRTFVDTLYTNIYLRFLWIFYVALGRNNQARIRGGGGAKQKQNLNWPWNC
jgi:hypothetical protein